MVQIAYAAICRKYGPTVAPLPFCIEGKRLLWGLGGIESSFGADTIPRLEPYYVHDPNGGMPALLKKYGLAAAMSYGPLQMMFVNAPEGATPQDFEDDDKAMLYSVDFLNKQLQRFKPLTLETIGQIWNGGEPMQHPDAGVIRYCADLERFYNTPMPEAPNG